MALKLTTESGHDARSAKTRDHLIDAAIEVIGAVGYDGATTREITRAAGANLSAIPYHFGGKKELYVAAAARIADYMSGRFDEIMQELRAPSARDASDENAAGWFEQALTHLLKIVLENAEPHSWTSFVARCTYSNDDAFALIHQQAIGPLIDALVGAAAQVAGKPADDEVLRLRVSALVTAIVGFRFQRGITLRAMGWETLQDVYAVQLRRMLADLCSIEFLGAE